MTAAQQTASSGPDPLELYLIRDDLAHAHNPANAYERMLVTQMARLWLRLQRALDTEERYFATRDSVEVIATKLPEFKAVTRYVTDCERALHRATEHLEQVQRRRKREDLSSPNARRASSPAHVPPTTSVPPSVSLQGADSSAEASPKKQPAEHPDCIPLQAG